MNHSQKTRRNETVKLSEIKAARYQRAVDSNRAKRIAKTFNEKKLDAPLLSFRDGEYWVIDGLHRITAMRIIGMKECECSVIEATYEEEAELFYTQNENKKPISIYAQFQAMLEAGDNSAIRLNDIVNSAGFAFRDQSKDFAGSKYLSLAAVSAMIRIQRKYDDRVIRRTLLLIKEAWGSDIMARRGEMLEGVAHFVNLCEKQDKFDIEQISNKLSLYKPSQILSTTSARGLTSSSRYIILSEVLTELYNKSRRNESNRLIFNK